MKKRLFLGFLLVLLLSLVQVNNFALAGGDDYPAPDPKYGNAYRADIINKLMTKIDEASATGEFTPAKSFYVKRRVNDISKAVLDEKIVDVNDKAKEIAEPLSEVYSVFTAVRENSGKMNSIKNDIDKLAATTGAFDSCNSLSDEALKEKLHDLIGNQRSLGYNGARQALFSDIDNFDGKVACVYTRRSITCNGIPSANLPQAMNTEHTWPKSLGAGSDPAKCDLNHLYPTDSFANSTRSSYPFGMVTNAKWSQGGSSFDGDKFMPREDHRGKVARAYFYFSVRYNMEIKNDQETVLRDWHEKYPVVQAEKDRNEKVFKYQGNRNPFVDRPDFVSKIKNF